MDYLDRIGKNTLKKIIYSSTPVEKIISINETPQGITVKGYVNNKIKEFEVTM